MCDDLSFSSGVCLHTHLFVMPASRRQAEGGVGAGAGAGAGNTGDTGGGRSRLFCRRIH